MPREGTAAEVRWFDVEPCYVFHPLNAYDDGDNVVVDVLRHPKMFDRDFSGPNEGPSILHRWTVDLNAGKVREDQLDDHGQEFPRVDERLVGKQHRFGYSVTIENGPGAGESLLKHDLVRGTTVVHTFGNGRQPGEFIFVPSHPHAAEDEGILMGFVYDPTTQKSDLTVLDAATLDKVGRTRRQRHRQGGSSNEPFLRRCRGRTPGRPWRTCFGTTRTGWREPRDEV
jgi:carotenoid cleavage dioxygenase